MRRIQIALALALPIQGVLAIHFFINARIPQAVHYPTPQSITLHSFLVSAILYYMAGCNKKDWEWKLAGFGLFVCWMILSVLI